MKIICHPSTFREENDITDLFHSAHKCLYSFSFSLLSIPVYFGLCNIYLTEAGPSCSSSMLVMLPWTWWHLSVDFLTDLVEEKLYTKFSINANMSFQKLVIDVNIFNFRFPFFLGNCVFDNNNSSCPSEKRKQRSISRKRRNPRDHRYVQVAFCNYKNASSSDILPSDSNCKGKRFIKRMYHPAIITNIMEYFIAFSTTIRM